MLACSAFFAPRLKWKQAHGINAFLQTRKRRRADVFVLVGVLLGTLAVGGRLQVVHEEDLLGKVKVTMAWAFPDKEALHWGDGHVVHDHVDHLHLRGGTFSA